VNFLLPVAFARLVGPKLMAPRSLKSEERIACRARAPLLLILLSLLVAGLALVEELALVADVVFVGVAMLVELSLGSLIVSRPMVLGILFRFSCVRLWPSNAGTRKEARKRTC
jgi:hypothetical protein